MAQYLNERPPAYRLVTIIIQIVIICIINPFFFKHLVANATLFDFYFGFLLYIGLGASTLDINYVFLGFAWSQVLRPRKKPDPL
jgi:hypothetical protein